jgi:hypothetical protein
VLGQPPGGQSAQAAYLGRADRLGRRAEQRAAPRLDLAEHQIVAVPQDQVDLAVAAAPVPVQHDQALRGEVSLGQALAVRTDRLSLRRHGGQRGRDGGAPCTTLWTECYWG